MKNKKDSSYSGFEKLMIIILLLFIGVSLVTHLYVDSNRIKKQNELITKIQVKQNKNVTTADSLVVSNDNYVQLQKEFLELKRENIGLNIKIEENKKDWLTYLANFWTILGLILGTIAVYFSFKEKLKFEVAKKIAEFTKVEVQFIKRNLEEFQKHMNLKQNSKIVVLNEKGTGLPKSFKKVINLYPDHEYLEIKDLKDWDNPKSLEIMKSAKLVVIENQAITGEWKIGLKHLNKICEGISVESKKIIEIDNKKIEKENAIPKRNLMNFKKLAEEIGKTTPLIYYGHGHFPRINDDSIQENVTFANAPSQLYSNMLNMLKFKLETQEK